MPRSVAGRILLSLYALFLIVLVIGLLLPAQGRMGPVRPLTYSSGLRNWVSGIITIYDEQGELPETYHLLFHERYAGAYPVAFKPGFACRDHLHGQDEFYFGPHDCRKIEAFETSAEALRSTAKALGVGEWSWEPITDFWFSRDKRDWEAGSSETIVAMGRIRDKKYGTLVYFAFADGHIEFSGFKYDREGAEIRRILDVDKAARERLGLAPFPPEFESWLLTGEPASVGDGTSWKFLIPCVLMLSCVIGFLLIPRTRIQCGATLIQISADQRGWVLAIHAHLEQSGTLPETCHVLVGDSIDYYPGTTRPFCMLRRVEEYKFGTIECEDILGGNVNRTAILDEAKRLGVGGASWEYLSGCWFSREADAYRSKSGDVIVSINRQHRRVIEDPSFHLCVASGAGWAVLDCDPEEIARLLETDRTARERLGLAPFPPEFESWLLTGEPASVGAHPLDISILPLMSNKEPAYSHTIVFFVALLLAVPAQIYWLSIQSEGMDDVSVGVGYAIRGIVALLIPMFTGWVAYKVMGRKQQVGTIAGVSAAAALAAVALTGILGADDPEANRDVITELRSSGQEMVAEHQRMIEAGEPIPIGDENISRSQSERLANAAAGSTGDQKKLFEVMSAIYEEMVEVEAVYDRALTGLQEEGWYDVTAVQDVEELRHRVAMTEELAEAASDWAKKQRAFATQVRERLVADGVSPEFAQAAARPLIEMRGASARTLEVDVEYMAAMGELFGFYIEKWGTWEYDPEQQMLLFSTDEDVAELQEISGRVAELEQKSRDATQAELEVQSAILGKLPENRRRPVLIRELLFALVALVLFLFLGKYILGVLHITQPALQLAGAMILLLLSIPMIFPSIRISMSSEDLGEPFIVPLAVPLFAGPSALAMVMLLGSGEQADAWPTWLGAVVIAWLGASLVLMVGNALASKLGKRGLAALERLMGMLLVAIAVEMALSGYEGYVLHLDEVCLVKSRKSKIDEFAMPPGDRPPMGPVALALHVVGGVALFFAWALTCAAHVVRELEASESAVLSSYELGEIVGGCIGALIVPGFIVMISWGVGHASRLFGAYVLLVLALLYGIARNTRLARESLHSHLMDALLLVLAAGACLLLAYFTYARWLSRRVFDLRDDAVTPATELEDGSDFVPTKKSIVFGHHFTSIAGTGPIVGPAIAVMWGWLPAILWVVFGSIFVGAVHDLGSLVVSLRSKGRSIGDIAGDLLGPRARLIFLFILIMGLWIVLAIFGLVVAAVLRQYPSAITPVLIQVPIALVIGLVIHRKGKSIVLPSAVALGLMYLSVIFGDVGFLHEVNTALAALPTWAWVGALLIYAYVASVLPVWTLLQPRDYINALQLITSLGVLVVGLVVAGILGGAPDGVGVVAATGGASGEVMTAVEETRRELSIVAPMVEWQPIGAPPMLPVLFITIACGACSGFHCLVGSGTTSKQLKKETDATAVGYGSMLTEGFLATLVIASCVAGIGLGASQKLIYGSQMMSSDGSGVTERSHYNVVPIDDRTTENPDDGLYVLVHRSDRYDESTLDSATLAAPPLEKPTIESFEVYRHEGDVTSYGSSGTMDGWVFEITEDGREGPIDPVLKLTDERKALWVPLPTGRIRVAEDHASVLLDGPVAFEKTYASWQEAGSLGAKVGAFVQGSANLIASTGIPRPVGLALMAVLVASFAGTTMDTACRLQRYVVQELSRTFLPKRLETDCASCGYDMRGHLKGIAGIRDFGIPGDANVPNDAPRNGESRNGAIPSSCPECGTMFVPSKAAVGVKPEAASVFNPFRWLVSTHGATLFAVLTAFALAVAPPPGQAWTFANAGSGGLILWPLFGATNQLLGGFAFIVITSWLLVRRKPVWFIALPALFMLAVPASAMTWQAFIGNAENPSWVTQANWLLVVIACFTLALEAWLIIETLAHWTLRNPFDALRDDAE
ncbi:cstA [Symbiodinium necroappetens]|uniref:CstA protein n=1 Tax=Symbiodinium necroappetens TaxID=1628268 RepID=A0A812IQB0_9DINO|nr:cstA [Symbiodinium necroappetens]